jgi:hypothetical protein
MYPRIYPDWGALGNYVVKTEDTAQYLLSPPILLSVLGQHRSSYMLRLDGLGLRG